MQDLLRNAYVYVLFVVVPQTIRFFFVPYIAMAWETTVLGYDTRWHFIKRKFVFLSPLLLTFSWLKDVHFYRTALTAYDNNNKTGRVSEKINKYILAQKKITRHPAGIYVRKNYHKPKLRSNRNYLKRNIILKSPQYSIIIILIFHIQT